MSHTVMSITRLQAFTIVIFLKTTTRFPPATATEPRLTANWQVPFLVLPANFVPLFLEFFLDTTLIFSFIPPPPLLYHYFPFGEIKVQRSAGP